MPVSNAERQTTNRKEFRGLEAAELRVLNVEEGEPTIEGYAVLWDNLSEDLGGFQEQFRRGAFADSIANGDPRVVWQHDGKYVFGRQRAGTGEFLEDDRGLLYRSTIPDAQWARDAVESIRRGDVTQNSFMFWVERREDEEWEELPDGRIVRTVLKARLIEAGPQTVPAYPDTVVALRSLDAWRETRQEPTESSGPSEAERTEVELFARKFRLLGADIEVPEVTEAGS